MTFLWIGILSFVASCLTFFSGFGLNTILMPTFALFFPIEQAIATTALVHFLNNIFKFFLTRRNIDMNVMRYFGIIAFFSAIVGGWCLGLLSKTNPLYSYEIAQKSFEIMPLKLIIGLLIIIFAFLELRPKLFTIPKNNKYLILGGLLSGFFGGLSGHQGALRSTFLIKYNLSKESFVATGVVIAFIVDTARLTMYGQTTLSSIEDNLIFIVVAAVFAFAGSLFGNILLKKVSFYVVNMIVSIFLFVTSMGFCLGIL